MPSLRSTRPLALAAGALAAALVAATAVPAHADPVRLTVSVAAPVVTLPVGDGFHDTESLVVTASDAATAAISVQRSGGAASVLDPARSLAAGTSSVVVPTAGLTAGTYTAVVATVDGGSASTTFVVEALHATVTKLAVQRSVSTVFPVKDGYRDSVTFTVTPSITGPKSVQVTGTAKLTRAGRTARSWKLHAGVDRLVWNGKVGSAVKPGRYTLTVQAKGPQGGTRTARTTVSVSAKRLVTRIATVSRQASTALSRYQAYDAAKAGVCGYSGPLVGCTGYEAADGASFSVIVGGGVSVPRVVRSSTDYAKPEVRVGIHTTKLAGTAVWGSAAGSAHATGTLASGTTAGKWLRWSGDPATTSVFLALDDDSSFVADRITFTYRYRALV